MINVTIHDAKKETNNIILNSMSEIFRCPLINSEAIEKEAGKMPRRKNIK